MLDVLQMCVQAGEKLGADFVEARFDDLTLAGRHAGGSEGNGYRLRRPCRIR